MTPWVGATAHYVDNPYPTARQRDAGQWLRDARVQAGLTAEQLAKTLNIDSSQLNDYELGKNAVLESQVAPLAGLLGVPVEQIRRAVEQVRYDIRLLPSPAAAAPAVPAGDATADPRARAAAIADRLEAAGTAPAVDPHDALPLLQAAAGIWLDLARMPEPKPAGPDGFRPGLAEAATFTAVEERHHGRVVGPGG